MSRWWWVRHGPTHAKGMVGWSDLPADLSDAAALARLRAYLPSAGLLVSSDLRRATATAAALAGAHHRLPPAPDLREIHFGAWEGRLWAEIDRDWPDLAREFWTAPGDIAPPAGESWNDTRARVDACVDALSTAHPGQDIVAVAHFGVILTQLQRARGVSAAEILAQKIDPLSVTCLTRTGDGWEVGPVNHIP